MLSDKTFCVLTGTSIKPIALMTAGEALMVMVFFFIFIFLKG